jgi:type II secretory ATPase GspE/PulE/Tfp pilus assembly ATPase PilB-like protein
MANSRRAERKARLDRAADPVHCGEGTGTPGPAQTLKHGIHTLRQEAIELVAQDVTTVTEVRRSIYAL